MLKLYLPFADKNELELKEKEGELILSVKNETRRFPKPAEARGMDISGAKYQEGYLNIRFSR